MGKAVQKNLQLNGRALSDAFSEGTAKCQIRSGWHRTGLRTSRLLELRYPSLLLRFSSGANPKSQNHQETTKHPQAELQLCGELYKELARHRRGKQDLQKIRSCFSNQVPSVVGKDWLGHPRISLPHLQGHFSIRTILLGPISEENLQLLERTLAVLA